MDRREDVCLDQPQPLAGPRFRTLRHLSRRILGNVCQPIPNPRTVLPIFERMRRIAKTGQTPPDLRGQISERFVFLVGNGAVTLFLLYYSIAANCAIK